VLPRAENEKMRSLARLFFLVAARAPEGRVEPVQIERLLQCLVFITSVWIGRAVA